MSKIIEITPEKTVKNRGGLGVFESEVGPPMPIDKPEHPMRSSSHKRLKYKQYLDFVYKSKVKVKPRSSSTKNRQSNKKRPSSPLPFFQTNTSKRKDSYSKPWRHNSKKKAPPSSPYKILSVAHDRRRLRKKAFNAVKSNLK